MEEILGGVRPEIFEAIDTVPEWPGKTVYDGGDDDQCSSWQTDSVCVGVWEWGWVWVCVCARACACVCVCLEPVMPHPSLSTAGL